MMNEHTPELERLYAAHRQIPDPDPAVLDAVRERLLAAADREAELGRPHAPHGRAPRRRLAFAAAAVAAVAGAVALTIDVGGSGGPRVDPIAQARAALTPPDGIVHYAVSLSATGNAKAGSRPFCDAGPLEVWRAADPTRWRAVQPVAADRRCGTVDISQGYGPIVAPRLEVSYADGRTSSYVPGRDLMLVIVDDDAPEEGERRAPSSAAHAASIQLMSIPPRRKPGLESGPPAVARAPDPVTDVERLLARGELHDAGEQVRDGRRVRVLTGRSTRGTGGEVFERTTIEYVVDPENFTPIAATVTTRSDLDGEATSASVRATFANYERIALTRTSAELLEIRPERRPKVVELTIDDIKNPGR